VQYVGPGLGCTGELSISITLFSGVCHLAENAGTNILYFVLWDRDLLPVLETVPVP
jgi:hypothetical protein